MDRLTFRQLFHALPSPHMLLDRDFRYVAANPAYERAVDRREEELLGRLVDEAFPNEGESGDRLRSSLRRALESGRPDTLAYIPYAIERSADRGGGLEERFWTAVHTPLFAPDGSVAYILQNTVDITEIVRLREVAAVPFRILPGEMDLVQRAREAEAANRIAHEGRTDFQRLFDDAPGMVAVLQGPDHIFTFANRLFRRFIGNRHVLGMPFREAVPELKGQGLFEMFDAVYETGVPTEGSGIRVMLSRTEGQPAEEAFVDFSFRPIHEETGRITGVFFQATDQTEAVLAGERQRLLLDELNHRVKNTLSSVQSIARQSFRGDYDPALAQATFDARVQALSKAHDVLSERHWESAELRTVLMQELSIYDGQRVRVRGPSTRLRPKAVIAFAMVFHELASNAVKYGSLSRSAGDLLVEWKRNESGGRNRLTLEWRERGDGPDGQVKPAFGLKMLQRIITGELDGDLDLAFEAEGLICRLEVPLAEIEDIAGAQAG